MIVIAGLVLGAAYGWIRAGRAGGNRLDRLQYAAVHAILFSLIGVAITIAIDRMALR
jgi:hypothetical protein